ncbi:MAG: hypothetical protein K2K04_02645 [Clostridia bacterium]|nr:hypothetical protein [Clostridia bacterium]
MIYKNGVKQYVIICCTSGLLFGLFMGIYNGLVSSSLKTGIIAGIVAGVAFGVLFTVAMAIFSKCLEKKAERMRAEVLKDRKIICEGPANHKKGANAIGGWLFFTENSIEFYAHKVNIGGQNIVIPCDDVTDATAQANKLIIQTESENYIFIVNKSNLWEQSIKEAFNSSDQ